MNEQISSQSLEALEAHQGGTAPTAALQPSAKIELRFARGKGRPGEAHYHMDALSPADCDRGGLVPLRGLRGFVVKFFSRYAAAALRSKVTSKRTVSGPNVTSIELPSFRANSAVM